MKNIIGSKIKNLFSEIPLAKNLARQNFISEFTLGVIKSRNDWASPYHLKKLDYTLQLTQK